MAGRRFGPVVVTVLAAAVALLLRLYQLQVGEHQVWADQAASLVRSGRVVPYRRGDILDRRGRVLVHDVESYRVVFAYRDFRREHPLGQVASALSCLELRCVTLTEAWGRLDEIALSLVGLSPAQLEAFARGEALASGILRVPACDHPEAEERRSRRGDVVFYATRLLGLERGELARLTRLVRQGALEPSYLELGVRVRENDRATSVEALRDEILARLERSRGDLQHLARMLAAQDREPRGGQGALERLLERLEGWRTQVEDGAAGDLFEEACDFEPGRVDPEALGAHVDLGWIEGLLRWDEARSRAWLARARAAWLEELGLEGDLGGAYALPQLLVEAELAPVERDRTEIVLARWTQPFLAPEDAVQRSSLRAWILGEASSDVLPLRVFAELDDLFDVSLPRAERPSRTALFAFQDRGLLRQGDPEGEEVLARAELAEPGVERASAELRARLQGAIAARAEEWRVWQRSYEQERFDRQTLERWTRGCWSAWEQAFQARLGQVLARMAERAGRKLTLAAGRLDRASERARFALRDHGGRPALVVQAPAYELVHLLSRRPESYAGFEVEPSHERVQVPYAREGAEEAPRAPLDRELLGRVRTPQMRDLYVRREDQREFQALRRKGTRTAREQERFEHLAGLVPRSDEQYGSDGLEGYFDLELSGRNGYREASGLQEELERGARSTDVPAVDGDALELTLDAELQLAALEVLERPRSDPDDARRDPAWLARPTGAIVLLTVEGEVLAMASYPDAPRGAAGGIPDQALERALRLYATQPPGSVMKPFVAAWALDHQGLDPGDTLVCAPWEHGDSRAGYKTVHCNVTQGHGSVDLHDALRRSCNSYFAWIGDTYFDARSYLQMYAAFGFGQPSGVRCFGPRPGLREDGWRADTQPTVEGLSQLRARMLACNGLGLPQTTVMQVARAYAGLATGRLPELRLVRSIGGEPVPARGSPLPISHASLDSVRDAMWAAANTTDWPAGSAAAALHEGALGFAVSAKTGSADLQSAGADEDARVPKHTWLASFFPPEEPRVVLVVFCHRTLATASHSAIWIAQQYLQHPLVRAWLQREGVLP